jgi:hypothetical protein
LTPGPQPGQRNAVLGASTHAGMSSATSSQPSNLGQGNLATAANPSAVAPPIDAFRLRPAQGTLANRNASLQSIRDRNAMAYPPPHRQPSGNRGITNRGRGRARGRGSSTTGVGIGRGSNVANGMRSVVTEFLAAILPFQVQFSFLTSFRFNILLA